jgi:hypothetical protein
LIAVAALAPAVATWLLVRVHLDAHLGDFVPAFENDQIGYWHYVLSFGHVGFESGYYTPNEHPAAAGLVHFDVHGPFFPMLYGSVARLVGWDLDSGTYFNMRWAPSSSAWWRAWTGVRSWSSPC